MTKEELIHITLKQLSESLKISPENFRLEDPAPTATSSSYPGPTIVWQFRVKVDEDKFINDPLNATKTIIVCYTNLGRQLQCNIYNREVNSLNSILSPDASATINYSVHFHPMFYRTFRQFEKLRKGLHKLKADREYVDYMKRLNGIFPATHEDEIFK